MRCREGHLAATVVCPGSPGCYCRVVVDDPMPFGGPPPSRDPWVLGQSVPFSPDKWRDQLPSCDLWAPELDGLCPRVGLAGGRALTAALSSGSENTPHSHSAPRRLWWRQRSGAQARKDSGAPGGCAFSTGMRTRSAAAWLPRCG